jgi:endonuclease III
MATSATATDFGACNLTALAGWSDGDALAYLCALPGVGLKTARCVLMYSLGRPVLPVDTHLARLARRLGLVDDGLPYTGLHEELEEIVAPADRYALHVNALTHGRLV